MPAIHPVVDFSNLEDFELSQMLEDYGVNVGPINAATRMAYERKLARLKLGQQSPPTTSKYPPVDDDEEEEEEDVGDDYNDDSEISFRKPESRQATTHQPTASVTPGRFGYGGSPARQRQTMGDYSGTSRVDSRPSLGASGRMTESGAAPSRTNKSESSKGLPLWVKLIALLAMVVLVYLIYANMEPQAVSNIPGISNKVEV